MSSRPSNCFRQIILPITLAIGDVLGAFVGLSLGYWIRYASPLKTVGVYVEYATFQLYLPLLLVGVFLLIATYSYLNLYNQRLLLRKFQSLNLIFRGTTFWFFAYLGISLALKFEPPISRLFVLIAYATTLLTMYCWRSLFHKIVSYRNISSRLQLRVAILGHNSKAERLVEEVSPPNLHPFQIVGFISAREKEETSIPDDWKKMHLGDTTTLEKILKENGIDILIAANLEMPQADIIRITETCEKNYVDWKVIPSVFDIFISNLRLQTYGNVPVLGIEDFSIFRLLNRITKRCVDILISLVGLILFAPLIALLGILIKRESSGPLLFHQERIGANHRSFIMLKLRSMQLNTDADDQLNQSTSIHDPRLLKIGRFMRKWNLDELPQFWNVLKGDMSIVGPRPERPFHVDQLSETIPHYMPRHLVKPGMTGWAQVNRLRGISSLEKRIQYDIYYIENWSLWFDLQIIFLTFLRWKNES
jgi:exopolysaccharide biosynthesis polyprenyl glycosylphosphotransferase